VIEAQYSWVQVLASERFIVQGSTGWGVVDAANRAVIPLHYDQAFALSDHIVETGWQKTNIWGEPYVQARVQLATTGDTLFNAGYGLVSRSQYSSKGNPTLAYQFDGKWGWLDAQTGRVLIGAKYEEARPFEDGLALAKENGYWGILEADGSWWVRPRYEDLEPVGRGHFAFKQGEFWGILDDQARVQVEPRFLQVGALGSGALQVRTSEGWVLFDLATARYLTAAYPEMRSLSADRFAVGRSFIEREPDALRPTQWVDHLVREVGLVNGRGEVLLPPVLSQVRPFVGGRACVAAERYYAETGYFDPRTRSWLWELPTSYRQP
jgi:hypothetical protein